jgi:hypothetical protein
MFATMAPARFRHRYVLEYSPIRWRAWQDYEHDFLLRGAT